jgi:hypothetical protein
MVNKPLVNRVRLMLLCLAKRKYLSAESLLVIFVTSPPVILLHRLVLLNSDMKLTLPIVHRRKNHALSNAQPFISLPLLKKKNLFFFCLVCKTSVTMYLQF